MVAYSIASARETDGAENLVIMNGIEGFVGGSDVYLEYLTDGYIHLFGNNENETNGWRLLTAFMIEPGTYTLTGVKGSKEKTAALQLRVSDETGYCQYLYQWDDDVVFTIDAPMEAILHVRIYPNVKEIDLMARPALYRER